MRTCILFNPKAGCAADFVALRERLTGRPDFTFREGDGPERTARLAAEAARDHFDQVVAAGGDGTVHAVVGGLANSRDRVRLGILPCGTGNDLSRTLGIPLALDEALAVLEDGTERCIDLIRVEIAGRTRFCVNVTTAGFSGQMGKSLTDDVKEFWGPLAYLRGAGSVLAELTSYRTRLWVDDGPAEELDVLNVVVANGRTAGAGLSVAPRANPEDGLLDLVIVRYAPLLDLTVAAAQLMAGNYLESDAVTHRQARRVRLESEPALWYSIDGELIEAAAADFTVLPRALRVAAGPGYSAEPKPE